METARPGPSLPPISKRVIYKKTQKNCILGPLHVWPPSPLDDSGSFITRARAVGLDGLGGCNLLHDLRLRSSRVNRRGRFRTCFNFPSGESLRKFPKSASFKKQNISFFQQLKNTPPSTTGNVQVKLKIILSYYSMQQAIIVPPYNAGCIFFIFSIYGGEEVITLSRHPSSSFFRGHLDFSAGGSNFTCSGRKTEIFFFAIRISTLWYNTRRAFLNRTPLTFFGACRFDAFFILYGLSDSLLHVQDACLICSLPFKAHTAIH